MRKVSLKLIFGIVMPNISFDSPPNFENFGSIADKLI